MVRVLRQRGDGILRERPPGAVGADVYAGQRDPRDGAGFGRGQGA